MPANAVTDEACPDGNEWVVSTSTGDCHGGRSRPTSSLMPVVVSEVATITPTVKNAARRWPRTNIRIARTAVMIAMPMVLKISSIHRSGRCTQSASTAHAWAPSPRSSKSRITCQPWSTAMREQHEQDQAHGGPARAGPRGDGRALGSLRVGAGTATHSMPVRRTRPNLRMRAASYPDSLAT